MFEVTERASGMIQTFLDQQKKKYSIRLLIQAG